MTGYDGCEPEPSSPIGLNGYAYFPRRVAKLILGCIIITTDGPPPPPPGSVTDCRFRIRDHNNVGGVMWFKFSHNNNGFQDGVSSQKDAYASYVE